MLGQRTDDVHRSAEGFVARSLRSHANPGELDLREFLWCRFGTLSDPLDQSKTDFTSVRRRRDAVQVDAEIVCEFLPAQALGLTDTIDDQLDPLGKAPALITLHA